MVRSARSPERPVVGAVERVAIPDFGIVGLEAKIDTGARTSALHVDNLEELGNGRVRFELPAPKRKPRVHEARIARRGRVRSTSGKIESRVFITVRLRLGENEHRVEVGLVDRRHMLYRMLLGRSALAGRFLVDPGRRFLLER
jgi:hypothetical protein